VDAFPSDSNNVAYELEATVFCTIQAMFHESPSLWSNPLFLPSIIASDHLSRLYSYCSGKLTEAVIGIEDQLGMTRTGRRNKEDKSPTLRNRDIHDLVTERFQRGEPVEKSQAMDLTIRINTQCTKVLFSKRSPLWNREVCQFLISVLNETEGKLKHQAPGSQQFHELLEHNMRIAKSIEDHVVGLQTRLDLQLSVVCLF
jgi:hypothetical protein